MKINMPERILDRQVGGNTTYARNVARGLLERGISVGRIPAGRHPILTAARETFAAKRIGGKDEILHYVADTGPLMKSRARSVVTVHGVASRWITTARTGRQEFIWRQRVSAAIKHTDHVITVSESSADDVSTVFDVPRDNISVIHHGIDVALFNVAQNLSDELQTVMPPQYILYVGNIEPRKNLLELIRAVDLLPPSCSIPLVIAGRPAWNYEETMRAIAASPNVIYLGFVSDADRRALMQNCQFFVFPSLYEGFGFPILEAMAAGAPVLSTDKGSLAEVRGPARLIPGTDRESIKSTIELALADSTWTEEASVRGREWSQTFSWDQSVTKHIRVYERLLR